MVHLILPLLLAIQTTVGANANADQATHATLTARYVGKTFTVRSFLSGNRIRFDADGKHLGGGTPGVFALAGNIHVDSVTVSPERIEIRGREAFLVFNPRTEKMEELITGFGTRLEFARKPNVPVEAGIDAVLLSFEDLVKILPPYWAKFLTGPAGLQTVVDPVTGREIPRASEALGLVPRPIQQDQPRYPEPVRRWGVSGSVVLRVVVDEQGKPQVVDLVEPLGYGLDQAAIDAVNQWKFEPARSDGKPVKVYIRARINFSAR